MSTVQLENGLIVFFREVKTSSQGKADKFKFDGHGFGVLLGHVPLFKKDPPPLLAKLRLGEIGYLSLDDLIEFLGPKEVEIVISKYREKYSKFLSKEEPQNAS